MGGGRRRRRQGRGDLGQDKVPAEREEDRARGVEHPPRRGGGAFSVLAFRRRKSPPSSSPVPRRHRKHSRGGDDGRGGVEQRRERAAGRNTGQLLKSGRGEGDGVLREAEKQRPGGRGQHSRDGVEGGPSCDAVGDREPVFGVFFVVLFGGAKKKE